MIYLFISLVIIISDQIIKYIAASSLVLGSSVEILGILKLTLVHNYGAAFGGFANMGLFLISSTVIAIVVVMFLWRKSYMLPYHLYLSIVIGGAIGNLIDRIYYGYVVDYIDFTYFPVFNLADICIVCGFILLAYKILRS